MLEFENYHLSTIVIIINSGKNINKTSGWKLNEEWDISVG